MSEFGDLSIALSGLYAQQQAMDVTGQNITNANTTGYTRERVDLQANAGPIVPAVWSQWSGGGEGVSVAGTTRMNDSLLDEQAFAEHGQTQLLTSQQSTLNGVQQVFSEPSSNGIQSMLSAYWSAWHDVANNPGDLATRNALLASGQTLTQALNQAAGSLQTTWSTDRSAIDTAVSQLNSTTSQIARLNQQIVTATQAGLSVGSLQDQRDQLVMNLAESAGVTAKAGADGTMNVYLGGTALVQGSSAVALQVSGATSFPSGAVTPPAAAAVTLTAAGSTYPVSATSGTLGGLVSAVNTTLPGYGAQLDTLANVLATNVNAQQQAGWDLNGNAGTAFFGSSAGGPVTAATITVALTDPATVAASAQPPTTDANGNPVGNLDGGNATLLGEFGQATPVAGSVWATTTPAYGSYTSADADYQQLVANLGVSAQTTSNQLATQTAIAGQVDSARAAQSGVNLDEEMTNMILYQHAYEGAAKYLTTVNQLLDTVINMVQ